MGTTFRYLDAKEIRAWRVEGSVRLRVQIADEQTVLSAAVKRSFPLSKQSEFLSILDGAGKEVGILRTLEGLDDESRTELEAHLNRRYFTPQIDAILELSQEAGMWRFRVRTQRGMADFFVRNWRDSAYEISPHRWHIHSVDGGRFEIPNLEALDANSLRLLDQLL